MPIVADPSSDTLRALLEPGECVRFHLVGDLDRERRFARVDLALTDRRLLCAEGGKAVVALDLANLTEVKVDELFGSGRLVAKTRDGDRMVAYHSRMVAPEFATFARLVNDTVAGRPALLPDSQPSAFCVRCGAPLRDREAPCGLCVPKGVILRRLVGLMRPYRKAQWLLTVLLAIATVLQLIGPIFNKHMVDDGIIAHQGDALRYWCGLSALLLAVNLGLRYAQTRLTSWIAGRLVVDVRSTLHAKIQRLRQSFLNKRDAGELHARVLNDTNRLKNFLVDGMPFLVNNALMMVGTFLILLRLDPWLAVIASVPAPLLFLGGLWRSRRMRPLHHRLGSREGVLHSVLGESIQGIRTIKAFSQQTKRVAMFDGANERQFDGEQQIVRMWSSFSSSMPFVTGVAIVAIWLFGGNRFIADALAGRKDGLTLGTLIAFISYANMLYGPLQWFSEVFNWMSNALSGAERIFALLDEPTEDQRLAGGQASAEAKVEAGAARFRGEIEFQDVRFSYERGKEVLKGISFRIEAGMMIGLVGRSGTGKSTIINLISRFYEPDSGRILIDGQPVEGYDVARVRRSIGVVMQDPFLFNASIIENIRFGRPDATFADVVRAARAANAHEFIVDKEDGYDTLIGEGGAQLSGGERQRLSIARAILDDPPILILDEATSAVDSETERAIQEAIAVLIRGRTTIAIAHRLATLRNARHLLVLEDGKVAEEGTHEQLLAREDGVFARLVRLQTENNRLRTETFAL